MKNDEIKKLIKKKYSKVATGGCGCGSTSSCCNTSPSVKDISKSIGYTEEEINSLILTNLQLLNSEVSQIITTEQAQRDLLWGCLSDLTSLKNP